MELCEDLVDRVQLYGITQYLDEQSAIKKLQENWKVSDDEDLSMEKQVATVGGYFAHAVNYIFKSAGDFLCKLGIVGTATGMASRYAVGYAMIHPGYFVTALVSSVAV